MIQREDEKLLREVDDLIQWEFEKTMVEEIRQNELRDLASTQASVVAR